jgi:hypothetical protein
MKYHAWEMPHHVFFFLSTYANMPQEEKTAELQNKHTEITV